MAERMKNITISLAAFIIFSLGFMLSEYRHKTTQEVNADLPTQYSNETNRQILPEQQVLAVSPNTAPEPQSLAPVDTFSWEHIHTLINNMRLDEAIRLLQNHLQTHTTSAQALQLLARCYQKQAKPVLALDAWFRYLKLEVDAKKIDIALQEIKRYLQQLHASPSLFGDDYNWLIAQFDTLLQFNANDGELHLLMASLYINANDAYQAQYHALMAANDPNAQKRAETILAKLNGTTETDNEKNAGEIIVPLQRIGNQYLISANVEGYPTRLLLDTGASLSGLSNSYTTKHPFMLKNTKPIRLNTASGAVNSVLFTVDYLNLGELVFNQHILTSLPMDTHEEFDGLLGVDILGRFDFVIDQNASVLRLKARK